MTVTIPFDADWKALWWAKENCLSYITTELGTAKFHFDPFGWDYDVVYYFNDEKDAVLFALRWA
jgi:hypothetical protein